MIRENLSLKLSETNLILNLPRMKRDLHTNSQTIRQSLRLYIDTPNCFVCEKQITKLFVEHMHQSLGHLGYRVVITNLRQNNVYILRGNQLLKYIASKCIKCHIARRDLSQQQMGQLPAF